jgi:hypothetical protein
MKITIKDPSTGAVIPLEARPESYHHEQGYRIFYPTGSNFLICCKLGAWRIIDDHHVDPDMLVQIGLAIEGQEV